MTSHSRALRWQRAFAAVLALSAASAAVVVIAAGLAVAAPGGAAAASGSAAVADDGHSDGDGEGGVATADSDGEAADSEGEAAADGDGETRFYKYTAADGTVVIVDDPERLPEAARGKAETIRYGASGPQIYRYRASDGRTVYVNDLERVPAAQRSDTETVDLSHIDLNSELAEDLSEAIHAQYEALIASDPCRKARAVASWPWWRKLWHRHSALVYLAAILLFVILIAPWVIRATSFAVWMKIVTLTVPVLLFVGLSYFMAAQVNQLSAYFGQLAAPCLHDGLAGPGDLGPAQTPTGAPAVIDLTRGRLDQINAILDQMSEMDKLQIESFQ
ncbi:MAG: hypothetical protein Tsb0020_45290 [Haliangiales bacterium]